MSYDSGPGQPYGLGPRLSKDQGADRPPVPTGEIEERRPTPNATGDPEQEEAEVD